MFLFILESLGTLELILIGIVALIFLGPRRLPEIAKKAGKIMSEFRGTANEFKQTWQREVDFDEEKKALNLDTIEDETVVHEEKADDTANLELPAAPAITEIDPETIKARMGLENGVAADSQDEIEPMTPAEPDANDKRNWL